MKRIIFYFLFLVTPTILLSQNETSSIDSTKVLFSGAHYSYMQWDLGYSRINMRNTGLNGFDVSLLGVVFNEKWFTSFGFTGWASSQNMINVNLTAVPPKIDSYVSMYLNNEFLIKPKNLINFSIPLKIGYGSASGYDTIPTNQIYISNWNFTGRNYYRYNGTFWSISPGVNILVNLFKPLSLGVGVNYRFAFGVPKVAGPDTEYSNYNIVAFLRVKFDTKTYTAKMLERQKEYYKNLPAK